MVLTFEKAVNACPLLAGHCQPGKSALSQSQRNKIKKRPNTKITGSINVDEILLPTHPNDPRWDYGIGFRTPKSFSDQVCWVEIHPATAEKEIKKVIAKKNFHRAWLKKNAPELDSLKGEFVWIATGSVDIPHHRLHVLAQEGIKKPEKILEL